jgi:hypothetical protein
MGDFLWSGCCGYDGDSEVYHGSMEQVEWRILVRNLAMDGLIGWVVAETHGILWNALTVELYYVLVPSPNL